MKSEIIALFLALSLFAGIVLAADADTGLGAIADLIKQAGQTGGGATGGVLSLTFNPGIPEANWEAFESSINVAKSGSAVNISVLGGALAAGEAYTSAKLTSGDFDSLPAGDYTISSNKHYFDSANFKIEAGKTTQLTLAIKNLETPSQPTGEQCQFALKVAEPGAGINDSTLNENKGKIKVFKEVGGNYAEQGSGSYTISYNSKSHSGQSGAFYIFNLSSGKYYFAHSISGGNNSRYPLNQNQVLEVVRAANGSCTFFKVGK